MPKETSFEVNADKLDNIAGRVLELHAEIKANSEKLRDLGLDKIQVGNYHSLVVGVQRLEIFTTGVKKRINEVRIERGDFSLNPSSDAQPNTATTKPKKHPKKKSE